MSGKFSFRIIIPRDTIPGIYYLGYILDSDKQIQESDETNNSDYAEITVEKPLDDHGDTPDTATAVELNHSISGNLGTDEDRDCFRFVLK